MLDVEHYLGPLRQPEHASIAGIVHDALVALKPPRRISVPDWAEQTPRKVVSPVYTGPWKNDTVAYMTEPARMATSRLYGAVVLVAPARTGKTDALILNTLGQRIDCMPRDMLIMAPTRDTARKFSMKKVDEFLRANPALMARIAHGPRTNNIFDKAFQGNMTLSIGWPVPGQLSMLDIPDVLFTDYDRFVDDVGEEGTAFGMGRKRTQTFGSLGMTIAESSPGKPVELPDDVTEWKAATPHEAPPCRGILSIYNTGTRGQFYWECPQCKTPFRPLFETLRWEKRGSNGETARTVAMICPHGCVIGEDHKPALNRSGKWLHETNAGGLCEIGDPAIRDTDVASYWFEGPIAAFQNWPQLVLRYLDAVDKFRRNGDELDLKTTITVDQGRPYLEKVHSIGDGLKAETLKGLAQDYVLGVAPKETRFVLIAVDVQPNRFVVQADAYGVGLERWLIDRFDIATPPDDAPGAMREGEFIRAIDPGRYGEDWRRLDELLERSWPVEGGSFRIKARAIIVDLHGAAGTTSNAYGFWRRMKRAGNATKIFLQRGVGGIDKQRALYGRLEQIEKGRKGKRSDVFAITTGTDPLKDEVALALTRREPGPGAYHLPMAFSEERPDGLPETIFDEFCAEVRTPKGWTEKRGGLRNEALDLAVYSKALAIVLKAEKIDWDVPSKVPAWAAPLTENSHVVAEQRRKPEAKPQKAPAPKGDGWINSRRGGGWLKR